MRRPLLLPAALVGAACLAACSGGDGDEAQTVTRVETGLSYRLLRNVRLKAAWQYDWRDGGRVRREGHFGLQVAYWF